MFECGTSILARKFKTETKNLQLHIFISLFEFTALQIPHQKSFTMLGINPIIYNPGNFINALILILCLCCVMFPNREKHFLVYYLHVTMTAISNFLHVLGAHTQVTHCSWTFQKWESCRTDRQGSNNTYT